jgi:hypothetical protein
MSHPTHYVLTRYGFEYGAALVERAGSLHGHIVLTISTGRQRVDVRVTPSGLIRVNDVVKNEAAKAEGRAP